MKQTHFLSTLFLGLCAMLCVQCEDTEFPEEKIIPSDQIIPSDHTLLVYIAGENSLSNYADPNIRSIEEGLRNATGAMNVVVFKDVRSEFPELFCLRRNGAGDMDTTILATFSESVDATDTTVMRDIISKAFSAYDTPVKGLLLWSHAMSWIPSSEFQIPTETGLPPSQRRSAPAYWGEDNTHYMELWELRDVLAAGPHLDYIISDACHFATAEVAYELADVTDYLLASPTEIMGPGFPYAKTIPALTQATTAQDVETALCAAAETFKVEYADNGTITLIRTAGVGALARRFAAARRAVPDLLADMEARALTWATDSLQHFGRQHTNALYYYYDVAELLEKYSAFASAQSDDGTGDASAETTAPAGGTVTDEELLDAVIAYEYHSRAFSAGESFSIARCCGLAVSVPEFFSLSSNATDLNAAYPYTKWGALMSAGE